MAAAYGFRSPSPRRRALRRAAAQIRCHSRELSMPLFSSAAILQMRAAAQGHAYGGLDASSLRQRHVPCSPPPQKPCLNERSKMPIYILIFGHTF